MTEAEIKRHLSLVRYGGLVLTVVVLIVVVAFTVLARTQAANLAISAGNDPDAAMSGTISSLLPYIIGFVVFALVLSAALYFGYRAYLMGKLKT